jgi:hypothetical protein
MLLTQLTQDYRYRTNGSYIVDVRCRLQWILPTQLNAWHWSWSEKALTYIRKAWFHTNSNHINSHTLYW